MRFQTCCVTFPPLPVSPRPVPAPAPRPAPEPAPRPASVPAPRPASAPSSGPNGEHTLHSPCGHWVKEKDYSKHDLRYKFASDGMWYVQGKNDPLSNMWPVGLHWDKYIFSSSEHIYAYELLKCHDQLNRETLQMLLNCPTGFHAKKKKN